MLRITGVDGASMWGCKSLGRTWAQLLQQSARQLARQSAAPSPWAASSVGLNQLRPRSQIMPQLQVSHGQKNHECIAIAHIVRHGGPREAQQGTGKALCHNGKLVQIPCSPLCLTVLQFVETQ